MLEIKLLSLHYYLLMALILISFYTDVKEERIPNLLTFCFILVGIIYNFLIHRWEGLWFSLIGFSAGIGVLLTLYVFKALGAGDVKLFGAIGACMGMEFTLYSMMYSIIYAGILGFLILIIRKQFIHRMGNLFYYFIGVFIRRDLASLKYSNHQGKLTFPFMYAVLPGVITTSYYYIF